jgi:hypothetical protein
MRCFKNRKKGTTAFSRKKGTTAISPERDDGYVKKMARKRNFALTVTPVKAEKWGQPPFS